jgi:hypothetical protein
MPAAAAAAAAAVAEFKGEAALWRALNKDPPAHLIRTVEEAQVRYTSAVATPVNKTD